MMHLTPETRLTISLGLAWTIGLAILSGVAFSAYHTIVIQEKVGGIEIRLKDFKASFQSGVERNRNAIDEIRTTLRLHNDKLIRLENPK